MATRQYTRPKKRDMPEYRWWQNMLNRCRNPITPAYRNYGGRGIAVCERWLTFENFLADIGPRPSPKHTLDRIDNARGYESGNVRWATKAEQMRNTRRNTWITAFGETMCGADWAQRNGLSPGTISTRLKMGWPSEWVVTAFPGSQNNRMNNWISAFGETLYITQWATRMGLDRTTISYRLKHGWSPERAVSQPTHRHPSLEKNNTSVVGAAD